MKKALLFGFNHYVSQPTLRGCVNDAVAVDQLLRDTFGYQTRLIVDEMVDTERFTAELQNLLEPVANETDGARVLYYAGHGFHAYDVPPLDEPDGVDEILCLPAYRYGDANSFIIDDVLGSILDQSALSNPWLKIFVVLDSCHSGTATHAAQLDWEIVDQMVISNFKVASPIALSLPLDDARIGLTAVPREAHEPLENIAQAPAYAANAIEETSGLSAIASASNAQQLLLSGCSQNQSSKELAIAGTYHGMFSYLLCQIANEKPDINWSDLTDLLNKRINDSFDQNPQLEGSESLFNASIF